MQILQLWVICRKWHDFQSLILYISFSYKHLFALEGKIQINYRQRYCFNSFQYIRNELSSDINVSRQEGIFFLFPKTMDEHLHLGTILVKMYEQLAVGQAANLPSLHHWCFLKEGHSRMCQNDVVLS